MELRPRFEGTSGIRWAGAVRRRYRTGGGCRVLPRRANFSILTAPLWPARPWLAPEIGTWPGFSRSQVLRPPSDPHLPRTPAQPCSHPPGPERPCEQRRQTPRTRPPNSPTPTQLLPGSHQVGEVSSTPATAITTLSCGPGALGPVAPQPSGFSLHPRLRKRLRMQVRAGPQQNSLYRFRSLRG